MSHGVSVMLQRYQDYRRSYQLSASHEYVGCSSSSSDENESDQTILDVEMKEVDRTDLNGARADGIIESDSASQLIESEIINLEPRAAQSETRFNRSAELQRKLRCLICYSTTKTLRALRSHFTRKHKDAGDKVPRCWICQIAFENRTEVRAHAKIHLDPAKPLACGICFKRYVLRYALRNHYFKFHPQTKFCRSFAAQEPELLRENRS